MKPTHRIISVENQENTHRIGQEITIHEKKLTRGSKIGYSFFVHGVLQENHDNACGLAIIGPDNIEPIIPPKKKEQWTVNHAPSNWDTLEDIWQPEKETQEG